MISVTFGLLDPNCMQGQSEVAPKSRQTVRHLIALRCQLLCASSCLAVLLVLLSDMPDDQAKRDV